MKILCIIPPYLPSYFNAGHHLPIFQVAAFLRKKFPKFTIDAYDFAALNKTWKEVCDVLIQKYDLIILMNDFDGVDTFGRFTYYVEALSENSKIMTFGRLSKQIPRFFFKFNFNAVHCNGDYESGCEAYIEYLLGERHDTPGVLLSPTDSVLPGETLDPQEWVMPNVLEIPYSAYAHMYKEDLNKFCGIPARQELVIPVARGCSVGCHYCDVPIMQGNKERRFSVHETIDYIIDSFGKLPFEYFSFYAPTFTLNQRWVKEFCQLMIEREIKYPWKCVTVLKTLSENLIRLMSKAGCVRISLGVETFAKQAAMGLPKVKHDSLNTFIDISRTCKENGVELNCFIILGLPGDTPEDAKSTIETCLKYHARVRPTIYTPYHLMKEDMNLEDVSKFNRQIFVPDTLTEVEYFGYYEIFYNNTVDTRTKVAEKIPTRQAHSQIHI